MQAWEDYTINVKQVVTLVAKLSPSHGASSVQSSLQIRFVKARCYLFTL